MAGHKRNPSTDLQMFKQVPGGRYLDDHPLMQKAWSSPARRADEAANSGSYMPIFEQARTIILEQFESGDLTPQNCSRLEGFSSVVFFFFLFRCCGLSYRAQRRESEGGHQC